MYFAFFAVGFLSGTILSAGKKGGGSGSAKPKPPKASGPVTRHAAEAPRRVRQLITPEGVDLRLELADASERAGAFLIDVAVMVGSLIVFTFLAGYAWGTAGFKSGEPIVVIWVLVYFLIRNAYFIGFELHRGAVSAASQSPA